MDLQNIKFGSLDAFNVIVEIEQGSNLKYEMDMQSGQLKLDFTFKDLVCPFYYGFIPQTLGGDGDALDAMILSSSAIKSGEVIQCRAVGILKTLDRGEVDNKIICVPIDDNQQSGISDVADLPPDSLEKWTQFYAEVAKQKNKTLEILGLGNKQEALAEIKNSLT